MTTTMELLVYDTVTATQPPRPSGDDAEMLVSTPTVDRQGDRVRVDGIQVDAFRRNPVLLWGHDAQSLPIGTVTQLTVESRQGLRARWRWLAGDEFAARVRNAWEQGIVRAASIGFLPGRTKPNQDGGQDYVTWELLEISLVALPANPEATRRLKALGLSPGRQAQIARVLLPAAVAVFREALAPLGGPSWRR